MLSKKSKDIFQDYMPNNICFGCGNNTKGGLHIKSYWLDEVAECIWTPTNIHQVWKGYYEWGYNRNSYRLSCNGDIDGVRL